MESTGQAYYSKVKAELSRSDLKKAESQILGSPTLANSRDAFWFKLITFLQLWVPGRSLRGDQAVTKKCVKDANTSSVLLSFSSLIDYISSLGLFAFIFAGAPGLSWGYSIAASTILLGLGNWSGRGMTNRLPGSKGMANTGLTIFVILSIAQSITSGLGVFLFSGSERVVEAKARELVTGMIADKRAMAEDLADPNHPTLLVDRKRCGALRQQADKGSYNARVDAYGKPGDEFKNPPPWQGQSWPLEQWPVCYRLQKKENDLSRKSREYFADIDKINERLMQTPTRLQFLQEYEPKIFNQNFKVVDGSPLLKNNAEAFGAAWNYFFSPPAGPRNDLTLSYVYMALSIITSTGAALQLITYSRHKDTLMSFHAPSGAIRSRLHEAYKLETLAGVATPPGDDGGIARECFYNGSLQPYQRRIKQVLLKGDAESRLEAERQKVETHFDLLDASPEHKGVILTMEIANKCSNELENFLIAEDVNS